MFNYKAPHPHIENLSFLKLPTKKTPGIAKSVLISLKDMSEKNVTDWLNHANQGDVVINAGVIETHDHASLDTIEITSTAESNANIKDQNYIIKFMGNHCSYVEFVDDFVKDAVRLKSTVIGFDYRGVNLSKQNPERFLDLVIDGVAQVQRLLDQRVDPQHIFLDGYSFGGMVAIIVASIFHYLGKPVFLWCDRTIASLAEVGAEKYNEDLPSCIKGDLSKYLWFLAAKISLGGFDIGDAVVEAYKSIPSTHKANMVIAKQSEKSDGDGIHQDHTFIHAKVKESEKQQGITTCYKLISKFGKFGHLANRAELLSKNNPKLTGQDIFEDFVLTHKK